MSLILNQGQEQAAGKVVKFVQGKLDIPFFTLTGDPGTGKTAMLKEAISRSGIPLTYVSGAAVAHAAKNVLKTALGGRIPCFTVAQWAGLKMTYNDQGEIFFKPSPKAYRHMNDYNVLMLDEASMIDDWLFNIIMREVSINRLKLIAIGDIYQLPPVAQNHDSKFFDQIQATLTEPMRFTGPISNLSKVYKEAIAAINEGYVGDQYVLNSQTNREDVWDLSLNSGYRFKNNIHEIIEQVAEEIQDHVNDLNHSRILAFKNETVLKLNHAVRNIIYKSSKNQLEHDELVISNGGFTKDDTPIIYNGQVLRVEDTIEIEGPYGVPCLSVKFKNFTPEYNALIPVIMNTKEALQKYNTIKSKMRVYALNDPKQWLHYYAFVDSFAYFDYGYSCSMYKA
jgi:frataxin-like iron-binding protein CyaY